MFKCPNYKSPEWKAHLGAVGEDYASATWSLNGGNPLNLTPDGNKSDLFDRISKALNTSDFETIAKVKRDLLLDGTIQGTDYQGEPVVSNFDKIIDNYRKGVFKTIPTNTPYKEFLNSNEQYRVLLNSYRKNPKLSVNVGVLDFDSDKANISLNPGESVEEGKQRLIDLGYHPRTIGVRQPLKNAVRKDKSLVVMNYEEQNNILNNMLDTLDERNEFGKPLYGNFLQHQTYYQNNTKQSDKDYIASEKTIRDLAERIADRIGLKVRYESDRTKDYKGKLEGNTAVINLAYATLDTPIHEILGHPIIRALKNGQPGDYLFETEGGSQLYQNLLKELEYGKGKEVLDRINKTYLPKSKNSSTYSADENVSFPDFDSQEDYDIYLKQHWENNKEEAIVELLGLYTADRLDNVKDGKLISLLKRLLKEMKAFMKQLLGQKEVEINKLPDNMTLGDIADLLAYSNSKLILPGNEVVYTTPDNQQFKTYKEASNHIGKLIKLGEVDLSNVDITTKSDAEIPNKFTVQTGEFELESETDYIKENDIWYRVSYEWDSGEATTYKKEVSFETVKKAYYSSGIGHGNYGNYGPGRIELQAFIQGNKEYEQSKETIEEWKKVNGIKYDPEEVYSRGQGFYSVVGAYSNFDVELMFQNLLAHIEDNKKAGGEFTISAFTKPIDKKIRHLDGGEGKIKFKIFPKSEDIKWAANTDVLSGSVWDASEKVSKDTKSELIGVSYTKSPSLNNIESVQPNLASIIDNLAHHHNELGIELTGSNFRLEYDDNVPYSTKKLIDNINNILDQKFGKLVEPEITNSPKQPTQTNENLKESIDSIQSNVLQDNYSKAKNESLLLYNLKKKGLNFEDAYAKFVKLGGVLEGRTKEYYKNIYNEISQKEYTSQALINTKIAALKKGQRKFPRSLIRSEVRPINNVQQDLFTPEDLPFQKVNKKEKQNLASDQKQLLNILSSKNKTVQIKPGVQELFESNPELANQVYEALGFKVSTDFYTFSESQGNLFLEESGRTYPLIKITKPNIKDGKLIVDDISSPSLYSLGLLTETEINPVTKNKRILQSQIYKAKNPDVALNSIINLLKSKNVNTISYDFSEYIKDKPIYENILESFIKNKKVDSTLQDILRERDLTQETSDYLNNLIENLQNNLVDKLKVSESLVEVIPFINITYENNNILLNIELDALQSLFNIAFKITPQQKQQAQQLYSQYLDTVFPGSKVKLPSTGETMIVYHGTNAKFDTFSKELFGKETIGYLKSKGFWFTHFIEEAENYGNNVMPALLNLKNPYIKQLSPTQSEFANQVTDIQYALENNFDGAILDIDEGVERSQGVTEYVAFEPEQIHTLGSKQDIEGFREFVKKPTEKPLYGVQELFESNPELANIGTPEQYSEYLDTIFPDSKVKNIVYHGSDTTFEGFLEDNLNYFGTQAIAKGYGENLYPVVIEINKPYYEDGGNLSNQSYEDLYDKLDESGSDGFISNSKNLFVPKTEEQIHTLGSKQDIEGFKDFVKKPTEEPTEEPLLSKYSPKYKNLSYNPDKTLDQQDSQERGMIDIEKELKILRTMLPEAPVKIYEALVNEGDMEGRFYNGLIEIATGAREGVMYHEAFHAVTQQYLSPYQRKKLYQEASKKYGNLSPLQLEEKLAEEFRDYMLAMGEFKKSKSRGKVIDWLFRNLKDLIDLFNGKKSRKSKLFENIRQGRYAHQPKFQVEKTLYSIMPKRIQGDTKMIREAVSGITYSWFNKSNIISFESDFDFNKNQKEVKQIFDEIYIEFEDRYMATEDPILEERYESILENWELYIAAAKIELKKFNINIKEDLEVDEENVSGDLNIKPAIHFSGKRNANNDVKFMIKMLQSTNKTSEYFGEDFPVLADFNESWRLLEDNLANLTPKGNKDLQTVMLEEIEALSEFYEPFKELLSKLKSPDVPAFKKRAFFKTLSKQINDLRGTVYEKNEKGEWTVKMMDADSQRQSIQMVNSWVEKFKLDKTLGESLLDRPNLKSQLSRFTNLKKAVLQKNKENGKLPYNAYEILSEILSAIGINVSAEGVRSFSYSFQGSTSSGKFLEALHSINFIFNKSNTSIEKLISGESKFQIDENFINDNNIVKKLALHETKFKKHKPDNMVVGADGKTYWTKSLNHNMSKEMNRWKNDIEHLKRLTSAKYHNRSVYLKHIQSQIEDGLSDNFGLEVFLFNRVEGDMNDYGVEYSELTDIDDTVERMQGVLNGAVYASGSSFSTLTHGDRSVWTKIKGMKFYKFGAGFGEFGKYNAGAAINIFYNYALAEIERISDLKKTNSNIAIFKDKGLKSEFFPQLSFDGDLAKELELYGENGELNLSEENQAAIKEHIGKSLKNLVNSEFNKMFESGVIVEKSQREIEYEKKKGNLSNNTFKIIGLDNIINLTYDVNDKKQGRENFYSMIADYVLNQTIANIETTMMFTGDPAFYKDLAKRTQMISATGEDLIYENLEGLMENSIHRIKEHFNVKIGKVDDVDMSTSKSKEVKNRYKNNLERLAKDIQNRKKVSKKKAVEMATVEMEPYRNITQADGQGWITPSRFRQIMIGLGKWNEDIHDPIYDKIVNGHGDIEDVSKLLIDLGFPLGQPLKGQHFELVYDEKTKRMIPFSLKYSQAILWPSIIKGTALEDLYQKMVVDDVQEFVDPTAVKFGGHNIGTFENHGESIKLSNYNWRLQNDLPSKYHKTGKAPKGTQPPKNIMANLEGKTFKIGEENITADEMISRINSVESKISDLGKQRLTKEFKLSPENKIQDNDGFVRSIVKQLLKDDMPQNVVRPLDENSKTPLDVVFQSGDKIENTIASKVVKSTVKIPANGGQFIQMSNQGFERMKGYKNISEMPVKTRENLIWLTNEAELKGPRIETINGEEVVKPGQVFIPYKVVEKIPDFEERIKSGELTGAMIREMLGDTLNLIGYRIPNQNLTSNDSLEIAGILPPFAGDSVVTFTEIPAKTGSDFDIDKMYTLMYNVKWNKETGKLEKIKPFKNKDGFEIPSVKSLENERIDLWRAVLESPEMFPQLIKPLDALDLRNNAYYIEVLGKVRDNQTEEGNKVLEAMGYETIDEFLNDSDRESKAVDYLENENLEPLEFFSPSHQLKLKEQNMAGKAGIGQTANHVVHISLAQQAKLQFGVKILNRGNFDESGTTLYNETNENGDYITQVISSWLNAYVDNAKDPYISYINNNLRTAPTVFMLLRAGIDPSWVNSFMSQPILKAYVKNLRRTNTRLKENVFSNAENMSLYVDQNGILKRYTKNSKVKDAIAQTFDDFGFSLKDLSLHIDETPLLKTKDLEQQIVDPDPNMQAEVLKKFLQLQKYAKELNTVVSASKADVGEISNVADAMSQHFKIERALEQPNIINSDKILSTNNMLSTFHNNSARLLMDMLSDKFLHATASAQYTVARIADVLGLDLTDSGAIKKILHHFKNYSLSDAQILHLNQEEQKEMLFGKNSMAVKMNILKGLFPDSVLFESFRIDLNEDGEPKFVYVPSAKTKDPADHDALWQEWEHFFNTHEDNPGSRIIGKKESVDLPVLPMTGNNISDIIEGYKSVTSRTTRIKDGEYQLPGGYRVKVTNLSPTGDPVLFKQFTDSEKYAKLEGFDSVEDMLENAKFPWTKAWIEGKRKLFAYRITPIQDDRTDLRVSDVMKDLVKFSYMTSGFNKNLFSFHDLIPYTYMRGDLNVYDENADQKGSFYRFVKHKLKELNNTIMYDESFIEQFVQHNVHDDGIVPGLNYNDKIVKPVEDKKKNGFYINSGKFPTKFNATPFNKIITPKQYVKLTLHGNSYLYKLAGETEGKIFYEAINKLGYYKKGRYVYEYKVDKTVKSIINENVEGLPEDIKMKLNDVLDDGYSNELGEIVEGMGDILKFSEANMISFKPVEVTEDGKKGFKYVAEVKREDGSIKEFDMGATAGPSIAFAKNWAFEKLSALTKEDIDNITNNPC